MSESLSKIIAQGHDPRTAVKLLPQQLRADLQENTVEIWTATGATVLALWMAGGTVAVPLLILGGLALGDRILNRRALKAEQKLLLDPMAERALLDAASTSELEASSALAKMLSAQDEQARSLMPSTNVYDAIAAASEPTKPAKIKPATCPAAALPPAKPEAPDILAVLERMAEDGCPLGLLLNNPVVVFYGPSQSGKSTLAHVLMIARLAYGTPVTYVSHHKDHPPIAAPKVGKGGEWGAIRKVFHALKKSVDEGDETRTATAHHIDEISELMGDPDTPEDIQEMFQSLVKKHLYKGAKVKSQIALMAQVGTVTALKLDGLKDALNTSVTLVEALPNINPATGDRSPSGSYAVQLPKGRVQTWHIPKWMGRDPVGWMLDQYPHLRETASTPPPETERSPRAPEPADPRAQLEALMRLSVESPVEDFYHRQPTTLTEAEEAILAYCRKRDGASARQIQQAKLGALKDWSADAIRDALLGLERADLGTLEEGVFYPS